jgi:hypothetical protein
MDSDEPYKQKKNSNAMSNNRNFFKPIRLRYISVQSDPINKRLLDYNVYYVCICAPIFWLISIFI